MEEIIVREGDQITISIEEYLSLQQNNKIMFIILIVQVVVIVGLFLHLIFKDYKI